MSSKEKSKDLKVLISEDAQVIHDLPAPPQLFDEVAEYAKTTEKAIEKATNTSQHVSEYAEEIQTELEKFRKIVVKTSASVKTYMKNNLKSIVATSEPQVGATKIILETLQRLQKVEQKKLRLEESLLQTEELLNKVHEGNAINVADVSLLKGTILSWIEERNESYVDQQKKQEEERKRKEVEERQRKEEEDRKKREVEDQKRKEEAEIRRKAEEDRRKREEEERMIREEEERKRIFQEKIARERKRQEEEAVRRRLDPKNWESYIFKRPGNAVDGFHKGFCCLIFAMKEDLTREGLECMASDDNKDIAPCMEIGEKLASSLVMVESKEGEKQFGNQAAMRLFLPHCRPTDISEEVVIKVSIDGMDWQQHQPLTDFNNSQDVKLVGVPIQRFRSIRVLVVAKARSQEIEVTPTGRTEESVADRNVRIVFPKNTFKRKTTVKLQIRQIKEDRLHLASRRYRSCENILSTSSLIMLSCPTLTCHEIEVDLVRPPSYEHRAEKGTLFHVYRNKLDHWKFADSQLRGRHMDVGIRLPSAKEKYILIEIEARSMTPKEEVLQAAKDLYHYANGSLVRALMRQKSGNLGMAVIECLPTEIFSAELNKLGDKGYSVGPESSREFCILDGEHMVFECKGNIAMSVGKKEQGKSSLPFYAYMGSVKQEVKFEIIDRYKQRDMESYMGHIIFGIEKWDNEGTKHVEYCAELPVTLPKIPLPRPRTASAPLQLHHNLLALAKFLAIRLTGEDKVWQQFMASLTSHRDTIKLRRLALSKCQDEDEWRVGEIMLLNWMKSKPRNVDKVEPILTALKNCGFLDILEETIVFERIHRELLSTKGLHDLSKTIGSEWIELAAKLGLSHRTIAKCRDLFPNDRRNQVYEMLLKWRISDEAVRKGDQVVQALIEAVETLAGNANLELLDMLDMMAKLLE